jgi:hypothetical protein
MFLASRILQLSEKIVGMLLAAFMESPLISSLSQIEILVNVLNQVVVTKSESQRTNTDLSVVHRSVLIFPSRKSVL